MTRPMSVILIAMFVGFAFSAQASGGSPLVTVTTSDVIFQQATATRIVHGGRPGTYDDFSPGVASGFLGWNPSPVSDMWGPGKLFNFFSCDACLTNGASHLFSSTLIMALADKFWGRKGARIAFVALVVERFAQEFLVHKPKGEGPNAGYNAEVRSDLFSFLIGPVIWVTLDAIFGGEKKPAQAIEPPPRPEPVAQPQQVSPAKTLTLIEHAIVIEPQNKQSAAEDRALIAIPVHENGELATQAEVLPDYALPADAELSVEAN